MASSRAHEGASKTEQRQRSPAREAPAASPSGPVSRLRQLQRAGGNQALQRLLRAYDARAQAPETGESQEDLPQQPELEPGEQDAPADGGAEEASATGGGVRDEFTPLEPTGY